MNVRRWLSAFAVVVVWGSLAGTASAQELLRPGTHPGYVSLGTGPDIGVVFNNGAVGFSWNFDFAAGYHFSGNASGPALGGDIQMTIIAAGGLLMTFAPRFTYDIQVGNMGLYVGPTFALGFGFATGGGGAAFALQPSLGVDIKLVLGDRGLLFLRPLNLNFPILVAGSGVGGALGIDIINFGGGVTF